jgi:hypothetical protein
MYFSRLKSGLKFRRFALLKENPQEATAGPTAITSGISIGSSTN